MVDGFVSERVLTAFTQFGIAGLILLILAVYVWTSSKDRDKTNRMFSGLMEQYKAETAQLLATYKEDIAAIRRLYENNAHLVKEYEATCKRAEALYMETISIVSLNTQTQTRLAELITNNLYCPMVRKHNGKDEGRGTMDEGRGRKDDAG